MRRRVATLLLTSALLGPSLGAAAVDPEVQVVVDRYLDALQYGDVLDLEQILGGTLRQKRQALLDNPDYAAHLAAQHADWTFQVLEVRSGAAGLFEADYVMRRDAGAEEIRKRLFLQPAGDGLPYRVVAERVLP